jgi:hypothetical protein
MNADDGLVDPMTVFQRVRQKRGIRKTQVADANCDSDVQCESTRERHERVVIRDTDPSHDERRVLQSLQDGRRRDLRLGIL